MRSFEEINHTADRAFRVTGRDMAALLDNAARAMQAVDGCPPPTEGSTTREIEVEGIDRETLLVRHGDRICPGRRRQELRIHQFAPCTDL